ncbi:hypothetical protein [Lentzea sp. CC55]|uniref:hypothetical protein n=1 Tax=Lentzea sp. CC55 TaxID=2884909 RepID=UPI001F3DF0CC|nr:hypothetical protein [Lentzea sp. CC55]MCG8921650.1 hypothetical protein [Lentzea sp. CC55]
MNRFRKSATIGSLVAAAALSLAGTSAAQAAGTPSDAPWCTGDDLVISAHDMRQRGTEFKGHEIRFAAAEGVTCTIGGSLSNVRFLDAEGQDMNVSLTGGQGEYREATVHGYHHAVAYAGSRIDGPRVTPAFIRFDLPGQGSLGARITTAWPSWIGSPVSFGNIGWPVS